MAEEFLIWSPLQAAWWDADRKGFTKDIDAAGRYTYDQVVDVAIKEARTDRSYWPALGALPVRVDDVLAIRAATRGRGARPRALIYD